MEVFLISDVGFLAQQGSMQALGRGLGRGFGLVFLLLGVLSVLVLILLITLQSKLNQIILKLDQISQELGRPKAG